jgi:transcription elongation factor GreA-like protein
VIEQYALGDRVSHDTFGLGRVTGVESGAVTIDFGSHSARIVSPYRKLEKF